ncbi:MAG: hypothetical protein J4A00_10970, partial [Gammaproteobacteria bacterium]|nr:hypothetical protein [Gammaproteobacteria bacterium]
LHDTEAKRNNVRISSSMEEIGEFYEAVMPRFEEIIQYLNGFKLSELPAAEENLLNLMFSFVEASTPIERFNSPIVTKSFPPQRFTIHEDTNSTTW